MFFIVIYVPSYLLPYTLFYSSPSFNTFLLDLPQEFSSDDLDDPEIAVADGEEIAVTLVCKVNILNGIANWKNVTYRIEWFAEGNLLKTETFCGNIPIGGQNPSPCPDATLISQLSGEDYTVGSWVRSFKITPLSLSILVLWNHKANLFPLLSLKQISCNVSAMFTTSPKNVWSPSKAVREPFFAGIQVNQ